MAKKENDKSIIGENSFFEGKFSIDGELQVDGKFEGRSVFIDILHITKKGKIKSNVNVNNAIIEGIIIGNINAKNKVMLLSSAKVLGNIRTPELIIQNGVVLEGKCTILNNVEQSPHELISKLYEEK